MQKNCWTSPRSNGLKRQWPCSVTGLGAAKGQRFVSSPGLMGSVKRFPSSQRARTLSMASRSLCWLPSIPGSRRSRRPNIRKKSRLTWKRRGVWQKSNAWALRRRRPASLQAATSPIPSTASRFQSGSPIMCWWDMALARLWVFLDMTSATLSLRVSSVSPYARWFGQRESRRVTRRPGQRQKSTWGWWLTLARLTVRPLTRRLPEWLVT